MSDTFQDFSTFSQQHAKAKFSEWLKTVSMEHWDTMINHKFTSDMAANTLPEAVFKRYLHCEHAFVRSAITIFSYALAKSPSAGDQDRLVSIVYALSTEQDKYFQETFRTMGFTDIPLKPSTFKGKASLLRDGAVGIAESCSFLEILSAMLAAEWMYLTWCKKAAVGHATGVRKSWIILHVTPSFRDQVNWMIHRVNELGMVAPADVQEACAHHFRNMLEWEIAFHDAPYDTH